MNQPEAQHKTSPGSGLEEAAARLLARPGSREVLAATMEQLQWVEEALREPSHALLERHPVRELEKLPQKAKVGVQGVPGAYSHQAAETLFPQGTIGFYEEFHDVAQALRQGEIAFGLLPVENSSAGQVGENLDLLSAGGLYINHTVSIRVEHCLCIHPDTNPDTVREVISHPQALAQCRLYLESKGLLPRRFSNTAAAAKEVARQEGPRACICSARGAEIYGLRILGHNIEDHAENYTRFACLSRENLLLPGANTISLTLTTPHEPGALSRLLTRFAACSLDLSKLLNMPIASRDFSARFYLDFSGSIRDPRVAGLLSAMEADYTDFLFLGNYPRID